MTAEATIATSTTVNIAADTAKVDAIIPTKQLNIPTTRGESFILVDDSVVFYRVRRGQIFHVMTLKSVHPQAAEHAEAIVRRWVETKLPSMFWKVWADFFAAINKGPSGRDEASHLVGIAGLRLEWSGGLFYPKIHDGSNVVEWEDLL